MPTVETNSSRIPHEIAVIMPPLPDKDDHRAMWLFIKELLEEFVKNPRQEPSMETDMDMYQVIHNFCTLSWTFPPNIAGLGTQFHCPYLYRKLKNYLTKHLVQILEKSQSYVDEDLLGFYIQEWDRYSAAAIQIDRWFAYLNGYWVDRAIRAGDLDVYDIFTLQFVQWKEVLLENLSVKVMAVVVKMVEKLRNGETIAHSLVRRIVDCFAVLGLKLANDRKPYLDIYREYFEKPFLQATTRYYENESAQYESNMTVDEYMKKLEVRVHEEKRRVGIYFYLHPYSINPLTKACVGVPIGAFLSLLQDGFQVMLDNDQQGDLARIYRLFSQTTEVLVPLRANFEAYIKKFGQVTMGKVAVKGENSEPKAYVDALFEVLSHCEILVNDVFDKDPEFERLLHSAGKEFVERNKFCNSGSNRSPELLTKHVDALLKNAKSAEMVGLDKSLAEIMTVFKYIEDKTTFNMFYSRFLAKRLINSSSSEEAEVTMINQLTRACGFEYTTKLQRMLNDVPISRGLDNEYKNWRSSASDDDDPVDCNHQILTTNFWPLKPPTTAFVPPWEIVDDCTRFEKFYLDKHCGRKLTWMWDLCKGEMRANFVKDAKTPYIFTVSAYQMAILLLFNETDVVTYDEAQEATLLSADWLVSSLSIFVKAKVLIPCPENGKPEPGTSYLLNCGFKNKRSKVNLNIALKAEQKQESEGIQSMIEHRRYLMQSAIARIMKSRRKMKSVDLVQETLADVKSRFVPKVSDIEKSIQDLVKREYLELLEGEELGYLA